MTGYSEPSASDRPLHSVAMVGVVFDKDRVLVTQRADNGRWETPAGVLERDEAFADCVSREVVEETGIEVRPLYITGVYKNLVHPLRPVSIAWMCEFVAGEPRTSEETRAVEWMPIERARELMTPAHFARVEDARSYQERGYPAVRIHDGHTLFARP